MCEPLLTALLVEAARRDLSKPDESAAMTTAPALSLCMIVRDEAELMPRFLSAVAGAWDEFIAVDTGSRDDTPRLLEAAGARVVHRPWDDDFAQARNAALAAATGRWILVLDADEFPTDGFAEELRALLAEPGFGAATIARVDEQKNGIVRHSHPVRVFANDPGIRYHWRIHEDAGEGIDAWLATHKRQYWALQTPVHHVGYALARWTERDKHARDERLLRLAIDEAADDLYSRYKLLELYRFTGQTVAATALAQACLGQLDVHRPIRPAHIAGDLLELIRQALFASDAHRGRDFLLGHAALAEHTPHFHLGLGMLHEALGDPTAAFAAFARSLDLAPGHPAMLLMQTRALCALTRLAIGAQDWASARDFNAAARAIAPEDPEVALAAQLLAGRR